MSNIKRPFLTLGVIVLMSFGGVYAQAQEGLRSNHSIGVNILGIEYSYEQALGSKCSLIGSVGTTSALGYRSTFSFDDTSGGGFFFNISPMVSITPRFYYNRQKRAINGKSITMNAGNYLALTTAYIFPQLYGVGDLISTSAFVFSPLWGMRRVYGEKWLLEFQAGLNLGVNATLNFFWRPAITLQFGYIF